MDASAYKQVLHLYELDRTKAKELYECRKSEVYRRLPRVGELDALLTQESFKAAKSILDPGVDTAYIKQRIHDILEEKRMLMEQAGIADDFLENVHKCPYCKDTGYISAVSHTAKPAKAPMGLFPAHGVQKCRCLKQRLIDRHYSISGLGAAVAQENFQSFEFKYYSNKVDPEAGLSPLENIRDIYEHCIDFVLNFGSDFSNLLLYGETGLGKTFLCNCIARDLLDAGITVLYVTAPRMFKKIENFRFNRNAKDTSDEQMELVFDCDLLIIDDLGSEFSTVVTDTELFNIINSRLLARRPTIISTNLSLSDFQEAYTDRIVSRITGSYVMRRLFGDDIRFKKKLLALGE